ncbi:hypothetical protein F5Y19DRAFT_447638 [Xylariaceae sp. FL1651]|nr:hypothetical protein F5Y19DRAFT_447638 [Xylariaceae sp. FL1651]
MVLCAYLSSTVLLGPVPALSLSLPCLVLPRLACSGRKRAQSWAGPTARTPIAFAHLKYPADFVPASSLLFSFLI